MSVLQRTHTHTHGYMYLVQSLYNVREVDPRLSGGQHLVEEIVTKQLQQVTITSLRPLTVSSKSEVEKYLVYTMAQM